MPWPSVGFGGIRLWDTYTNWNDLNPSQGNYDWAALDSWLALAQSHRVDVLYSFGGTPTWASSNPTGTCAYNLGGCYAPANMQDWDDFVRALVTHSAGRIKYWELWNEADLQEFWSGGTPTLVTMTQHAYDIIKSVDPTAIVLTPSSTGSPADVSTWMNQYFAAGGGSFADVVAFHGYPIGSPAVPEFVNDIVGSVTRVMAAYGYGAKPIWDTEASWGKDSVLPNQDAQAAYLARNYLLHWSLGVQRFYWYAWNDTVYGTLWDMSANTMREPATAYGEIYKWLVGATMSTPCAMSSDSVWSCGLTRPGGYEATVLWNSSVTFPDTAPVTIDRQFQQYRDLNGGVVPISGATVPVGSKPILLEPFVDVSLSQTSLAFSSVAVGSSTRLQTVILTNSGSAPVLFSSLAASGDYTQTNTCGTWLAVGAQCTISVSYAPTAANLQTGAVSISDNAPDTPQIISLNKSGVLPLISLYPASLGFSSQLIGTTSAAASVTLTNTGSGALDISSLALGGSNGADFNISESSCGAYVQAGSNCIISLTFTPDASGVRGATLAVNDNLPGSPHIVSLSGMGSDFSLGAGSTSATVTEGQTATYNLQIVSLGDFTGPITLSANCTAVVAGTSCAITPNSVNLTGAAPVPLTVSVSTPVQSAGLSVWRFLPWIGFTLFAGGGIRKRRHGRLVFVPAMVMLLVFAVGCAVVGPSNGGVAQQITTPPGLYTVVVTGASGSVSRSLTLTLVVQ